jgi:hypothetical protein
MAAVAQIGYNKDIISKHRVNAYVSLGFMICAPLNLAYRSSPSTYDDVLVQAVRKPEHPQYHKNTAVNYRYKNQHTYDSMSPQSTIRYADSAKHITQSKNKQPSRTNHTIRLTTKPE